MKGANVTDVFLLFARAALRYRWRLLFLVAFTVLAVGSETVQPWVIKELFDRLETTRPAVATIGVFLPVILGFAALKAFGWTMWRLQAFVNHRFQPAVMADLEEEAFGYLLGHSYRFFADTFAGSLVKKVGRLARAFERFADEVVFQIVPVAIVLVSATVGLALQWPLLAAIFVAWVAVFLAFNAFAARWAARTDAVTAALDSETGGALADAVSNAVTIKLFPAHRYEREKLDEALRRRARAQTRSWDRHDMIFGVQGGLTIVIEVALMYLGVLAWIGGTFSLGDLAFIQTFLAIVFRKVWDISRSLRHIFVSYADGKEMVDILKAPHGVRDARGARPLAVKKGAVAFKDVTFAFARKPVLSRFSLSIAPKEKVALVGPSGAGKSTITKLLFRFYDVQGGRIAVDGQDIARVTQDSLRSRISLVPQEPILFHRTLLENIRYGRRAATDAEVVAAAKKAHCDGFIEALPKGYGTYVGERGIKLSGGERQRVAIARAVLKDAPILVLDEATSSLDSESEALIQDSLKELMRDKTVIVIAHRLSTIMQMDRIVVVEQGRVVSVGTHQELLRAKGTYFKLWNIQAGGFAAGTA